MNRIVKAIIQRLDAQLAMLALLLTLGAGCAHRHDLPPPMGVSNQCVAGRYRVGKVHYNFEDEFDLIAQWVHHAGVSEC